MRRVTTVKLFSILLLLVLLTGLSGKVSAQEASPTPEEPETLVAFEIYPKGKTLGDYFDPTIEAGETEDLVVVLANTGNVVFEGRTYATNAFTGVNGGFAVADAGAEPVGVTTWLDYPEEVYSIDPGKGIERTFQVTVPENTPPGQYLTSLMFENAESREVEGSENFRQVIRFAAPVFITVPGPVDPKFEVGDVKLITTENTTGIEIGIINTGNVRVRPEGTVTISDEENNQLYSAPVAMGSVYARESTILQIGLAQALPEGRYVVAIELVDPETTAETSREVTVEAAPPATPVAPPPVQILNATGTALPAQENVQFLDIAATLSNNGDVITNARVVLSATHDGEKVEDFPLASSLTVSSGQTPFQARYIPATGWTSGTWSFSLSLEEVDPSNGVARVLASVQLDDLEIR